jgi:hypothetical protein
VVAVLQTTVLLILMAFYSMSRAAATAIVERHPPADLMGFDNARMLNVLYELDSGEQTFTSSHLAFWCCE